MFVQEKRAEANKLKQEKRNKPKPEEEEGVPQHQHHPLPAKHRRDSNPKYHEEQQKDGA
jgi:hypothetical protein